MKNMNMTFSWIEDAENILNDTIVYFSFAKELLLDNAAAVETLRVCFLLFFL